MNQKRFHLFHLTEEGEYLFVCSLEEMTPSVIWLLGRSQSLVYIAW